MACLTALTASTACYTLQPTFTASVAPGASVGLDITDAGRVALGGSMGPEIGQIEGKLLRHDSTEYLIAVSAIHLLRGGQQSWTGEQVRIKNEHVSMVRERRLSKSRTAIAGLAVVGALAVVLSSGLIGSGSIDAPATPSDTAPATRIPFPLPIVRP